jgi:hypothetical protein
MIFSQLVLYFGQAGRQDVDGNLTGHFSLMLLACQLLEEDTYYFSVPMVYPRVSHYCSKWIPD